MACLLWYTTCSGGTAETADLREGAWHPLLILLAGSKPWWLLCVVGASAHTPGPCRSFTPVVTVGHQLEGFLPMYISLSQMLYTPHSQDSAGPSLGGTPPTKTPSNMAHTSLSNPERSPKTTWDMALPHVISWGLADLLWRWYHISAMASTSYAMTCNPSMSSAPMWAYAYAISSSKKRNIFGRWPKQKRLTSSKFTTLRLRALKLGQPHTASLQRSDRHIFPGMPSLCQRMECMRKDIEILSWVLFF